MESKNTNKGLIWLIVILIVLVIGLMSFIVYKEFFANNKLSNNNDNTITTTTTTETEQKNIKIDENKDWVYDADYVANVKSETYTTDGYNTYNINDYKAPYININSSYAKSLNADIKKVYDGAVNVFNEGIEDKLSFIDTFEYKYYLTDNMLAVVLTTGYGATSVIYPNYYVYVINTNNGEKVELEEMLNYKKISKTDFDSKVKKEIINSYDGFYKNIDKTDSLYTEYYESLKQETLDTYEKDNNKKYFIDNNGNINLVVSISEPVDRGYRYEIISVDQ